MSEINITENNEQILNDIQMLQEMEQKLFNNLETNTNLTTEQKQKVVEKMNQLSNMRINLYKTLSGVNNFFKNSLSSSVGTLQQQTVAVGIVENELNQAKRRLEILESEKNNKIRLVEINDYFADRYQEHAELMKLIIFILIPIIILVILKNKGILPDMVYFILIGLISLIGAVLFWQKYTSIIMRHNMNYQEYNWSFDPEAAQTSSSSSTSEDDPWVTTTTTDTCVGELCCSEGQTYDASMNQCIDQSVSESFITESMINDILTKRQPGKYKDDANIGTIGYNTTKSFVNNSKIY